MTLPPGTRLGPYEIVSPLGAGGMGEVYKARDTRLDREVAVKVIAAELSASSDQRQRFEREARTISKLSHPHICALFDVGEQDGRAFLVMELLEGDTLADRLATGPLPLEQTLRCGTEIADALDKAHRHGIVHRDLKPGNIMLTKSGVKLLDFGLAKAFQPLDTSSRSAVMTTPPSPNLTEAGMFVGTLQYMAPEQLTGVADARSDIFALGTVLFEMTTGTKAFSGSSRVALASAILNAQPAPMSSLRPAVSPGFDRLVHVCLAKDPDDRWQHARDVALQLGSLQTLTSGSGVAGALSPERTGRRRHPTLVAWLIAAAATAIALMLALRSTTPSAVAPQISFDLAPPAGTRFADTVEMVPFAMSPDGTQIAMATFEPNGRSRVWIRAMSSSEPRALPGTEGAESIFWSPDGRSLGFFAGNKLKRIDIGGGAVVPLCDVREGIGKTGTWGRDGQILFATIEGDAIYHTSTAGEAAVPVVKLDRAAGSTRLLWPSYLPDGRRFLYLEKTSANGRLMLGELGKASREVMALDSNAYYVVPNQLLFVRESSLLGQRLNPASVRPEGEPFPVASPISYFFATGAAQFTASSGGALAYQSHGNVTRIVRIDRSGKESASYGTPGENARLFVSRDGRTAVFDRHPVLGSMDIWSIDLARGIEARITSAPGTEAGPVVLPGGRTVIFGSTKRGGPPNLVKKDLDSGTEEFLMPSSLALQEAEDVSSDGRTLLFSQRAEGGQYDLWTLSLAGGAKAEPYLTSPADETSARFSPDGRLVAFVSNDSGRREVHLASFPIGGSSTRVSDGGGRLPRWSADGRELFYLSGQGQLMAVPIQRTPSLELGRPVALFAVGVPQRWGGLEVIPDGSFIAMVTDIRAGEQPLSVVLNRTAALTKP